ncbi:MAG: class I SAM-dependent methyltransferase [Solirubrobacterales bacterium]
MSDWRSYDGVAQTYERIHAPRLAEPARDLIGAADPAPGTRLLDVGTGTGIAAAAAAAALGGPSAVVGIDASIGMLVAGRRARPEIRTVAAQVIDLPFRDGAFDTVVGNFVLAHFTKYQTALYELLRVLRPNGRLALNAWSDGPDELSKAWLEQVWTIVPRDVLEAAIGDAIPWRDRFRQREALEETFMDAGLRHIRVEQRQYRFRYGLEEYVEGLGTWATGRFVRSMLGERGFESFVGRVLEVFADRFSDPVQDFRDVLIVVGTKPY